jgi:RND family efflux transporter MFP subunit
MRWTVDRSLRNALLAAILPAAALGCGRDAQREMGMAPPREPAPAAPTVAVRDTIVPALLEAAGVAQPIRRAVLSTRLMGSVTDVLVHEGDRVRQGELLARIDARDLAAQEAQAEARIAEAEAVHRDAAVNAERFRALYADSAATRVQLEATETGLARAEAGLATARAARAQVGAVRAYAEIRAPFTGIIVRRSVDPGSFVAPGTPVVEVEDRSRLRIAVTVAPTTAQVLHAGQRIEASIEGHPAVGTIEGAVPVAGGALYTVNALVANPGSALVSGGAATLLLPQGARRAIVVPVSAIVREGDLTGVRVVSAAGPEVRWVRVGRALGPDVEVLSGLRGGEQVLVAAPEEAGR